MARLGDIGKIITGNTPKTSESDNYSSNDIAFIKPSDIPENEIAILSDAEFYISESAREKARILPSGSILITCIGIIGKVAITDIECAFNQQINAIIPYMDKCNPQYVAYSIQYLKPQLQTIANAAVVPILNKSQFSDIEIPLPPLDEQRRIAAVLDKVSGLIAKRREQLDKLDELVKARFVEMFGDPVSNPKGWNIIRLSELGDCKNGMNFHTDDSGVEIHCLGVGDFKNLSSITDTAKLPIIALNEMPSDDYLLKNGDIVFVRSNGNKALVGRSVIVYPEYTPTTFSGFCIRFRIQNSIILPQYLLSVLKTASMRKQMTGRGANIQNLNQKILSELQIPVPPLSYQEEYIDFAIKIDKSKLTIQQSLDKLGVLKKALMQQYFG